MTMGEEPEILVSSVTFSDGAISIGYIERRKQTPVAAIMETMMIETEEIKEEAAELEELVIELIEKGHLLIRNPPKKMRRGAALVDEVLRLAEEDGE
jgi:hypothetical protein